MEKAQSKTGNAPQPEHTPLHTPDLHHSVPVQKNKRTSTYGFLILILMLAFLIVVSYNQFKINGLDQSLGKTISEAHEAARPAAIQLTSIRDENCPDCFHLDKILLAVKSTNVNVTSEKTLEYSSEEAKKLISEYGITAIPSAIITGEINKTPQTGFAAEKGALIFQHPTPPYRDLHQNKVVGRVMLTIINVTDCAKCTDVAPLSVQLRNAGVSIYKQKTVSADSEEGKGLMEKYSITKLPAMLLSEDAAYYAIIQQAWPTIGSVESDGTYVMRKTSPPFYDTASGKVKGLATITLLNDSSCKECYDVTQHLPILKQAFGIVFETTKTTDASSKEGKALVEKYKITRVPTTVMTGVEDYESLSNPWEAVGTVESDGAYIFRTFENWPGHAYKDLSTGKLVENPLPQQPQQ